MPSIDLTRAFKNTLLNYGHKVIYRRYKTGVKSSYYDEATREGVGGPKWTYKDEVHLTRTSPTSKDAEYTGLTRYYLSADVKPKKNDCIIEVTGDSKVDSTVLNSRHRQIMRIDDIEYKRGCNGKVVFYTVVVKPEYGHY